MPTLREMQQAFANALYDERSVPGCVAGIRANGLSGERRLRVYRNNVMGSRSGALAAVYPVTRRLVGEDFFAQTARQYVSQVHSLSGDIHHYGCTFPHFLADLPGLEEYDWLPDVARLEWAYHSVFHSVLDPKLNLAELRDISPDDYPSLGFRLQSAARLVVSDYPILRIWQVNREDWQGDQAVRLDQGVVCLLVIRDQDAVTVQAISAGDYRFLERLACGGELAEAHESAVKADSEFDLSASLNHYVMRGVLVECVMHPTRLSQQSVSVSEV